MAPTSKEKKTRSKPKTPKKKEKTAEKAVGEVVEEMRPLEAHLEEPSRAEEAKKLVREEVEGLKEESRPEAMEKETEEEAKPEETEEEPVEEAKPEEAPEEEEEEELEIVEEKFYDLNMRRIWSVPPRWKRTPRAVRFLRNYVSRRMKTDDIAISEETNQILWARGMSKPPRKIRVRVVKDKDGHVIVFPGEGK